MDEVTDCTIDGRLARELSGSAKVAALLKASGFSYARLARDQALSVVEVKLCVYGRRRYPKVREVLARVLDLPRAEVDRLLDQASPVAEIGPENSGTARFSASGEGPFGQEYTVDAVPQASTTAVA